MLQARWEFYDEEEFEAYPANINTIIERAYQEKESYAEWPEKDDFGNRVNYRIDFGAMVEQEVGKRDMVRVRRNVQGYWT